jgi:hypothetical protein
MGRSRNFEGRRRLDRGACTADARFQAVHEIDTGSGLKFIRARCLRGLMKFAIGQRELAMHFLQPLWFRTTCAQRIEARALRLFDGTIGRERFQALELALFACI